MADAGRLLRHTFNLAAPAAQPMERLITLLARSSPNACGPTYRLRRIPSHQAAVGFEPTKPSRRMRRLNRTLRRSQEHAGNPDSDAPAGGLPTPPAADREPRADRTVRYIIVRGAAPEAEEDHLVQTLWPLASELGHCKTVGAGNLDAPPKALLPNTSADDPVAEALAAAGFPSDTVHALMAAGAGALDAEAEVGSRLRQWAWQHCRGRLPPGLSVADFVLASGVACLRKRATVLHDCDQFLAVDKPWSVRIDTPRGWPGKVRVGPQFDGDDSVEQWVWRRMGLAQIEQDAILASGPSRDSARGSPPIRFVHQLDFATSGVLLLARTSEAAVAACRAFSDRLTRKVYLALVFGWPTQDTWVNRQPLTDDPTDPTSFRVMVAPLGVPTAPGDSAGAGPGRAR
eukprot:EG_transcript_6090